MISGSKIGVLLLSMMLLPWSSTQASEPASASSVAPGLIAALGQPAPARTPFAEARFMKVLDQPLVVSGELAWLGGDQLQRKVLKPQAETATIADGEVTMERADKRPRHFSLKHAPQLQVLLDSFVALLSGDAERLDDAFEITQRGTVDASWTLTLVPRDARVAKSVASIAIDGKGKASRCMWMQEEDGDLAVDLLGPLALQMPEQPTRESLQALCRGTH